jgi:hypothetical protein
MNNIIFKIKGFLGQFSEFNQWAFIADSQKKMKVSIYPDGAVLVRTPYSQLERFKNIEEAELWIAQWRKEVATRPVPKQVKEIYI